MCQVRKVIVEIICYKCVNFGTILCVNESTNSGKIQKFLLFSLQFNVFPYISLQIRSFNEMILMFQVRKLIVEIIYSKCVNFGAISCGNECTNSERIQKFLLFSQQFNVFSYISPQIRSYIEMILMSQFRKLIVEIIWYKCVNFGAISCLNECTNSGKIQKFLQFSQQFNVFSYISLQIRSYNEMILIFQVCELMEEKICY